MFVDTDLLHMGADYSRSAGTIANRGAVRFASTQLSTGIFGDFDAALDFHNALTTAHQTHSTAMDGHHVDLVALADKANTAAVAFVAQDEPARDDVMSAGSSPL